MLSTGQVQQHRQHHQLKLQLQQTRMLPLAAAQHSTAQHSTARGIDTWYQTFQGSIGSSTTNSNRVACCHLLSSRFMMMQQSTPHHTTPQRSTVQRSTVHVTAPHTAQQQGHGVAQWRTACMMHYQLQQDHMLPLATAQSSVQTHHSRAQPPLLFYSS